MPKLKHCTHSSYWKELVVSMKPGEKQTVPCRDAGRSMRAAACAMGMRAAVNRIMRGHPEHVVTLLS